MKFPPWLQLRSLYTTVYRIYILVYTILYILYYTSIYYILYNGFG